MREIFDKKTLYKWGGFSSDAKKVAFFLILALDVFPPSILKTMIKKILFLMDFFQMDRNKTTQDSCCF